MIPSFFDLLKIKEFSASNKAKVFELISRIYSKKYTIKVHSQVIQIAKNSLNEMTNLNNLLKLKFFNNSNNKPTNNNNGNNKNNDNDNKITWENMSDSYDYFNLASFKFFKNLKINEAYNKPVLNLDFNNAFVSPSQALGNRTSPIRMQSDFNLNFNLGSEIKSNIFIDSNNNNNNIFNSGNKKENVYSDNNNNDNNNNNYSNSPNIASTLRLNFDDNTYENQDERDNKTEDLKQTNSEVYYNTASNNITEKDNSYENSSKSELILSKLRHKQAETGFSEANNNDIYTKSDKNINLLVDLKNEFSTNNQTLINKINSSSCEANNPNISPYHYMNNPHNTTPAFNSSKIETLIPVNLLNSDNQNTEEINLTESLSFALKAANEQAAQCESQSKSELQALIPNNSSNIAQTFGLHSGITFKNIVNINELTFLGNMGEEEGENSTKENDKRAFSHSSPQNNNNNNLKSESHDSQDFQNKSSSENLSISNYQSEASGLCEYQDIISNNANNIKNMLEIINEMILYRDFNQAENLKYISKGDSNTYNEYTNKIISDPYYFKNGFLLQNYINNGLVLEAINNFPKKGYSILFSFKWEPLTQQAISKKCDLFYFYETKTEIKDNKANKNIKNTKNETSQSQPHNKNIRIGFYILNRKIHVADSSRTYETDIAVIPGMSYVVLLTQCESWGFVRKHSKVNFFIIFLLYKIIYFIVANMLVLLFVLLL